MDKNNEIIADTTKVNEWSSKFELAVKSQDSKRLSSLLQQAPDLTAEILEYGVRQALLDKQPALAVMILQYAQVQKLTLDPHSARGHHHYTLLELARNQKFPQVTDLLEIYPKKGFSVDLLMEPHYLWGGYMDDITLMNYN